MRKYIREMMRMEGIHKKYKANRWVKVAWESLQLKTVGVNRRKANQVKGTHPKHLWKSRVALFASR